MKYRSILLILLLIASSGKVVADERYISPGIKLGYTFGKEGGFTGGFEVSYIVWRDNIAHAAVLVVDIQENIAKWHAGYQVSRYAGIDIGPTLVFRLNGKKNMALTATPFIGAAIPFLYYSHTFVLSSERDIDETGLLVKLPLSLTGHGFDIGLQ